MYTYSINGQRYCFASGKMMMLLVCSAKLSPEMVLTSWKGLFLVGTVGWQQHVQGTGNLRRNFSFVVAAA
jgi:hypothetical protein